MPWVKYDSEVIDQQLFDRILLNK